MVLFLLVGGCNCYLINMENHGDREISCNFYCWWFSVTGTSQSGILVWTCTDAEDTYNILTYHLCWYEINIFSSHFSNCPFSPNVLSLPFPFPMPAVVQPLWAGDGPPCREPCLPSSVTCGNGHSQLCFGFCQLKTKLLCEWSSVGDGSGWLAVKNPLKEMLMFCSRTEEMGQQAFLLGLSHAYFCWLLKHRRLWFLSCIFLSFFLNCSGQIRKKGFFPPTECKQSYATR